VTCHKCQKRGHIQAVCRSGGKQKEEKWVHTFEDSDSDEYSEFMGCLEVNSIEKNPSNVIWVHPEVQGKFLKMEMDTRSAVSVIPFEQYKEHFSELKLRRSHISLKTYTGEKVVPKGMIECDVKLKGQHKKLSLQVVETPGPALLGCDWLNEIKLDWVKLKPLKCL